MGEIQKYTGKAQTLEATQNRIGELVGVAAQEMDKAINGERVPLSDLDRVRAIGQQYLEDCSIKGILPTVRGVAARLGCSRQALYDAVKRHPGGALEKWLEDFSDLCGETVMAAALEGTVAAVPAIFATKARYGWREAPAQLEIGQINSLTGTDALTAAEIAAKYAELPED